MLCGSLILQRTASLGSAKNSRHSSIRGSVSRPQHSRHLHGTSRLRSRRPCPTPHAPPRHRDLVRGGGFFVGGVREHQLPAVCHNRKQGRCVCVPQRSSALRAQRRQRPSHGHRGTEQPESGSASTSRSAVRVWDQRRHVGESVRIERESSRPYQVQIYSIRSLIHRIQLRFRCR